MKRLTIIFPWMLLMLVPPSTAIDPEMVLHDLTEMEKFLCLNKSHCPFKDTPLGSPCNSDLFEKYGPVHLNSEGTKDEYNETYTKLKAKINSSEVNPIDVCFHTKYFLECDIVKKSCRCADVRSLP